MSLYHNGSRTTDRRYYRSDERESIVAVADDGGLTLEIRAYRLHGLLSAHWADGPARYGEPESFEGSRFQYTGQIAISEVGLYYYKARFYAPSLGRFLQTDPLGYVDGLNLYVYVSGDPVNLTDPSGLLFATTCIVNNIGFGINIQSCTTREVFTFGAFGGSSFGGGGGGGPFSFSSGGFGGGGLGSGETTQTTMIGDEFAAPCEMGQVEPAQLSKDAQDLASVAFSALSKINPTSVMMNLEFAGLIYSIMGMFTATDAFPGTATTSQPFNANAINQVPAGAKIVAAFHTHAAATVASTDERIGPGDRSFAAGRNPSGMPLTSFVSTPGGNFLRNLPGLSSSTNLTGNFGCVPTSE